MPPGDVVHADTEYDDGFDPEPKPSSQDCSMGVLAHVLGYFTGFIGPGILWAICKNKSPFVARHAREATFFTFTLCVYACLVVLVGGVGALVGYQVEHTMNAALIGYILAVLPFTLVIAGFQLVVVILACVAASKGKDYRCPLTLRLF